MKFTAVLFSFKRMGAYKQRKMGSEGFINNPLAILSIKVRRVLSKTNGAHQTTNLLTFSFIVNPIRPHLIQKDMLKFVFYYEFYGILIEFLSVNFTNKTVYFWPLV